MDSILHKGVGGGKKEEGRRGKRKGGGEGRGRM